MVGQGPLNDLQLGVLEKVKLPLARARIPGSLSRRTSESVHTGVLVFVSVRVPDPISHFRGRPEATKKPPQAHKNTATTSVTRGSLAPMVVERALLCSKLSCATATTPTPT